METTSQAEPVCILESQASTSSEFDGGEETHHAPNLHAPRQESQDPLQTNQFVPTAGTFQPPPSMDEARMACNDLNNILRPRRSSGIGYKDPGLDLMF
jgi:hypothetical protein